MAPSRVDDGPPPTTANLTTAYSLSLLSEYTHTLDSLPLELSRNFADLRELDAVLSSSMASITAKIKALTIMIEQGTSPKEERLWLLTDIAEEAARLKLGGEDKIRVACQAADSLKLNANHLKTLAENLPGFDATTLNRKTTYPHVAARSFMPAVSLETGRRRRGGYGSLLVSVPDASPAKRKRVQRDDDLDVAHIRSPRKDKANDGRSRARAKKTDRAASPSESLVSVTSHTQQGNPGPSRGAANPRGNGSAPAASNKRARSTAQHNGRGSSQVHDNFHSAYDPPGMNYANTNGHSGPGNNRRDTYNVPPPSHHPSLPLPYQANGNIGNPIHHSGPYDMHVMPQAHLNAPEWTPAQLLEGPGMPVSRSHTVHPIIPVNTTTIVGPGMGAEGPEVGDGDGDGDDRTYCICNSISYGEMIACDDSNCEREWFHLTCINLAVPPEGRWYCDECTNKRHTKRSGRGGKRRAAGGRAGARGG